MSYSVLIVDDEALTLRTLGRALGDEGFEVFLAMSGEEAIKVFSDDHPDFELLDVVLHAINGIEVIRQVKAVSPANHCSDDERVSHGRSCRGSDETRRL